MLPALSRALVLLLALAPAAAKAQQLDKVTFATNWVAEADRSEGRRDAKPPPADPGLTAVERDELVRLRRENR